ncbi:hypothetical protein [Tessaracoccus oleiagri]|uniref:Effector-binding domain-containing protein n=1 Tax=Tessaracoccus oleiagri TaxID=686624 RepID=A0A1G9K350_9ACTN|nr:hypothetical protein [Tessaracoccus oleiagri]SDL43834.1 effector-binding domain-containing protein [Tessaracoccus oleiagri]
MSISEPEILDFPGCPTVVVRGDKVPVDELTQFMDRAFTVLGDAIKEGRFRPDDVAFSRFDEPLGRLVTLEVGFPVETGLDEVLKFGDTVVFTSQLPAGTIATAKYKGGYDGLSEGWEQFREKVSDRGYDLGSPFWEAYDVGPLPGVLEEQLVTGLAVPVTRRQ